MIEVKSKPAEPKAPERKPSNRDQDTTTEAMLRAIQTKPKPVLDFAVTQLNAELVLFLREVAAWKAKYGNNWDSLTESDRITCYAHAALIYYILVDDKAYYPVNIHPTRRNSLAVLFRCAQFIPAVEEPGTPSSCSKKSSEDTLERPATPWDVLMLDDKSSRLVTQQQLVDETDTSAEEAMDRIQVLAIRPKSNDSATEMAAEKTELPGEMNLKIFDEALKEVKMQAYHNFWLPFVKSKDYKKAFS